MFYLQRSSEILELNSHVIMQDLNQAESHDGQRPPE